jgi:hypothetical protein
MDDYIPSTDLVVEAAKAVPARKVYKRSVRKIISHRSSREEEKKDSENKVEAPTEPKVTHIAK